MNRVLNDAWGNPSSSYGFGARVRSEIERSRESVAKLINARPHEVIFTSSGTEANNMALLSAVATRPTCKHIVTTTVEHSSVLTLVDHLKKKGYEVTKVPVDREGVVCVSEVESALREDTAIVTVMWANNETGVLHPVFEIGALCRRRGILFHCDAVQALGKVPVDVSKLDCDYLSFSAHKIHGPKGCGALWLRDPSICEPLIRGGHQEHGLRGGTEDVAAIVGFGVAAEICAQEGTKNLLYVRELRDALEQGILDSVSNAEVNGCRLNRIPHITNIAFPGVSAQALVVLLDAAGVCASAGSACMAFTKEPSHVIKAMKPEFAECSVRFCLDPSNTNTEIESACLKVVQAVTALRQSALA